MVAVPTPTLVTTPVAASTVATAALSEDQLPPASPSVLNEVVPLSQIVCVPLKTPAFGAFVTVTALVAVALDQKGSQLS